MRRVAGVVALFAAFAAPAASAQEASCSLVPKPSTQVVRYRLPSGEANTFMGGGSITMRCPSRGITLIADSVEQYGDERRIFMLGNVRYREPRLSVSSDYLTYFLGDERVVAAGSVVATMPSGSTLRGPQAEYRRAVPRVRDVSELYSTGRPTVTIVPERARGGRAAGPTRAADESPTTVTANVLYVRGDSLLYASGQVDIVRSDFAADADSVFMNTGTEYMRLMRDPEIRGREGRPFTLTGNLIDVYSRARDLERVVSRGNATAESDGLTLIADTIQFRVAEDLLQAAYAWGSTRQPEAVSLTQRIRADSIEVQMPQQRVRTMSAVGKALAEATPDTVQFITSEKDWLRGDTIIAMFDTVPASPGDSARAQIRELIAFVGARSYQHMAPRDTSLRCPAISYLRGDSLRATFDSGKVRTVEVVKASAESGGIIAEPDSSCRSGAQPREAPAEVPRPPARRAGVSSGGVPGSPSRQQGGVVGAPGMPARDGGRRVPSARPQPTRP